MYFDRYGGYKMSNIIDRTFEVYSGGIVRTDKSAIREVKLDDGLPINSGEVVIDEERIRQFFNNK